MQQDSNDKEYIFSVRDDCWLKSKYMTPIRELTLSELRVYYPGSRIS